MSVDEHHHHHKKKRAGKACDSCRIRKTKCDGKSPCSRCVANNTICAFVHKKKSKDKVHPSGYIEMLETRIDILTKSLQKLIILSEPHLPFLQEIIENARNHSPASSPLSDGNSDDESYIPINEVVSYLSADSREPHAASDSDFKSPDNILKSPSIKPDDENGGLDASERLLRSNEEVPILTSNGSVKMNAPRAIKTEPDLSVAQFAGLEYSRSSSSASIFSSQERVRGSVGEGLESLSGIGRQSSSTQDSLNMIPSSDLGTNLEAVDIFPRRSNSMFINNYTPYSTSQSPTSQSPVSSLSNKLEGHYLDESSMNGFRRSVSSKSHQRKNSGHVHKPAFVSHAQASPSTNTYAANNGNIFHQSTLSPATDPSEVDGYSQEDIKRINNEDQFSLASEKILNQPPSQLVQNDLSSYFDSELLSSNPFLN